jgi:hypothetical protein
LSEVIHEQNFLLQHNDQYTLQEILWSMTKFSWRFLISS